MREGWFPIPDLFLFYLKSLIIDILLAWLAVIISTTTPYCFLVNPFIKYSSLQLNCLSLKSTFWHKTRSVRGHSITTWTRWGEGKKMSVFVHAQGIKTVHTGEGGKKWQNSVHVVVEWPLTKSDTCTIKLERFRKFRIHSSLAGNDCNFHNRPKQNNRLW